MKYITGLINLIISLVVSTIIIYAINFVAGFAGADYSFLRKSYLLKQLLTKIAIKIQITKTSPFVNE